MKKITILTGPMAGHGGEETVISTFTNMLGNKYKFDLCISLSIGDTDWLSKIKKNFLSIYTNNNNNPIFKLHFIFNVLYHTKSRLIICLTPRMVFIAKLAQKLFFKKYKVVSWLQFSVSKKFSLKTAKMLKKADYHLAISTGIFDELLSLNIPECRIGLIYNPISPKRKTILPNESKTKILYVARIQLYGQKNLNELLNALALIDKDKKWELDIYGADDSEGKIETLNSMNVIKKLKLSGHVNWCGYVDDVWEKISTADCLVLSSKFEGFGMVLCEAISYGIPVISSDCPAGPKDIVKQDNGYLYPLGDVQTLANDLSKFINRETNFQPEEVKKSIQDMYLKNYKNKVEDLLDNWGM